MGILPDKADHRLSNRQQWIDNRRQWNISGHRPRVGDLGLFDREAVVVGRGRTGGLTDGAIDAVGRFATAHGADRTGCAAGPYATRGGTWAA
ncbi:hypothetical protein GZL_00677 [Streptomyces sp. 769]|nr:hypothetical protein GZL_00677 [Streptomyces sp. 769]